MKKTKFLFAALAVAGTVSMTSCDDDHHHEGCHECHIAWENAAGEEVEVGLGEFCDEALEDVEANGYSLATDTIIGADTIPAGSYGPGDIHCHDHENEEE